MNRSAMEVMQSAIAGTLESSDIMVTISPQEKSGIEIELTSPVEQQFGRQIKKVILNTARGMGLKNAKITAVDKGALDCTIKARTTSAICRACNCDTYQWGGSNP